MARKMTPFGLTVALIMLNVLPLHIPGLARVMPLLPLMAVYHWAINRPELMPAYVVFAVGLLQDTLTGAPLGISALVFLGVYGVIVGQRRFLYGKSFAVVWLGFSLVAGGASVAHWLLISFYYVAIIDGDALFFQYLLSLGIFPLVTWIFMRWQRAFLASI
ncbi:MAG TPA: rod shape-determining protein MreD [Rhodospirillales bacterium]|nr:rod shape-determining protein MreD [Rhodospirillales bacterium]